MRAAAGNASVVEDRQAAFVSVARVAAELRGTVADERSVVQWETPTEAFLREAERKLNVNDIVVMAQPMPYKFSSVGCVDADEPWQRNSDENGDVTGATHDKPTFGLDRRTKMRLSKFKGFSADVLAECKTLVLNFGGKRATEAQVRELLSIMPAGCGQMLGIDMRLIEGNGTSFAMLVDYKKRISDFVACVKAPPGVKRVVLKVIESIWAREVAAGNKFFECIANKQAWCNRFKGLKSGDLFVVAVKGCLEVAAVCEVEGGPCTKQEDIEALHSMTRPELHENLKAYLQDSSSFDFVVFRKARRPPQPLGARDLITRIGADMPRQWQGVVHVSGGDVHASLGALIETWPLHMR